MKTTRIFAILLLSLSSFCSGEILLEGGAGWFKPQDAMFRDIYSSGPIYTLEASYRLKNCTYLWASGSYFSDSGKSIGDKNRTSIRLIPLGIGLKQFFPFNGMRPYIAIGAAPTWLHIRNHSPFVIKKVCRWECGGVGKVGVVKDLQCGFFFDASVRYDYTKFHFSDTQNGTVVRTQANLSSISFQGQIGRSF